ncbi:MAG: FtsX-like permease family protein [Candidatus Bathyarchaeota archaeon]
MSVWIALKMFKIKGIYLKFTILVTAILVASFTLMFLGFNDLKNLPIQVFSSTILVIALSSIFLHATRWIYNDLGVLRALGAEESTMVNAVLVELTVLGFSGVILGTSLGTLLISVTPFITPFFSFSTLTSFSINELILLLTLLSIYTSIGIIVSVVNVWRKIRKRVVENLTYT